MTRIYSSLTNASIEPLLNALIDQNTSVDRYKEMMLRLGASLGNIISSEIKSSQNRICISSVVEDVDFLARGLLLSLESKVDNISFTCYWNQVFSPFNVQELKVAPIVKKYQEHSNRKINYLIFIKSVISETYVVRTNLMDLLQELETEKIFVVSPVISADVEQNLKTAISDTYGRLELLYYAKDDQYTTEGELFPGIGGAVYTRLGFSEYTKDKYIPELIKSRRKKFINV